MDWKTVVKTVSPWIGTALGGPLGGMAVEAAASALGLSEKTTDAVKQAISGATPEQMLALKQADQAFALQMQELGFKQVTDLEALAAGDRDSARQREIKTGDSWTPRVLAAAVVIGYFSVQWFLMTNVINADMKEIIMRSLGVLDTALGLVLGYYFGTSSSSRVKDEALAASLRNQKL